MTPEQKAAELEINIKSMGFQVDTFRGRRITNIVINYLIEEYKELGKLHGFDTKQPIAYWEEVREKAIKHF